MELNHLHVKIVEKLFVKLISVTFSLRWPNVTETIIKSTPNKSKFATQVNLIFLPIDAAATPQLRTTPNKIAWKERGVNKDAA